MRKVAALCVALISGPAWAAPIDGILEPAKFVELRAAIAAPVAQIALDEGDMAKAGDLIIGLEANTPQARVALAELAAASQGQTLRAQTLVERADAKLQRLTRAARAGAAKPWEVDAARQELLIAQADQAIVADQVAQARAQLALEQAALAGYSLVAPFDGVILELSTELGALATPQDVLVTYGYLEELEATFFVPARDAAGLSVGAELSGTVAGVDGVTGVIAHIDPRIDASSQTVRVVITIDNPNGALVPGSTISFDLPE